MALLVVLWIIASASILVLAFGATARSGASLASTEIEMMTTETLLDAGAEIAATHLIDEQEDARWPADRKPHQITFAGASLNITIADPNSLIDLNKADGALLLGLLRQFTETEQIAREIRDGILKARGEPPDDFDSSLRPQKSQKLARDPDRPIPFIDVGQLRNIPGVTLPLYKQIAPYLTVNSRDGLINPMFAPDAVLSAIPDMTLFDIEKVRAFVKSPSGDHASAPAVMDKVSASFTDEVGPAYIVSIETTSPGGVYHAANAYVLLPAFDNDAPYRLISKHPLAVLRAPS